MKTTTSAWPHLTMAMTCLALAALQAGGQTRTSTSYEVAAESSDCAGARQTSDGAGDYVLDASLGGIGGLSSAASPATEAKQGYAGQLYDVTGLSVSATPASVNENATRQLEAFAECDDETSLDLDESEVAWSVVSGPLTSIGSAGLATAATVYEDTAAAVQGSYLGFVDDLLLTVLNIGADNYGSYAGDGIDDDWQVLYFGEESPDAGPGENPDGDPDDNMAEFLTGFDPTDPRQWFQLRINGVSGTITELELNKVIPGRTYTVVAGTDLENFAETVTVFTVDSEEIDKLVEDPAASSGRKFYKVEVEPTGE